MARVLITGAAGLIASVLREGLGAEHELSGIDAKRISGFPSTVADMAKGGRKIRRAFDGAEVVVDLAASASVSTSWDRVFRNNLRATINAYEAACDAGVRRLVFASSNHVTGLYEDDDPYCRIVRGDYDGLDPEAIPQITTKHPVRPDSPYGIGKVFGEAAGRFYSETRGLSVICLRIGTCNRANRPGNPREIATLLTHADLSHLVDCCIRAPEQLGFAAYYGVSANTWRFWDIADAREQIGYTPRENAEAWRSDVQSSPLRPAGPSG